MSYYNLSIAVFPFDITHTSNKDGWLSIPSCNTTLSLKTLVNISAILT